jgi:hypothetical protein
VVAPFICWLAVLLRRLGKDLLQPKREPESVSYWISREPPAPGAGLDA